MALGVAARSAIAHADVKIAVGAEGNLSAVVVAVGLPDLEQHNFALRVSQRGVAGVERET